LLSLPLLVDFEVSEAVVLDEGVADDTSALEKWIVLCECFVDEDKLLLSLLLLLVLDEGTDSASFLEDKLLLDALDDFVVDNDEPLRLLLPLDFFCFCL